MAMRRRFRSEPRGPQIRVNHRIRVPEVRVVAEDGSNLGVLSTQEALRRARDVGLDLVEINPKGVPPVCKILDFGKFKYEESRKKREAKRKQTVVEVKEIKIRPKTDDHDLEVKLRNARRFLEEGNKVKVVCRFRGREIMHPDRAREQLAHIVHNAEDLAIIELNPTMEGRTMAIMLAPKPAILKKLSEEKSSREAERAKERELDRLRGREESEARRARQVAAEAAKAAGALSLDEEEEDEDEDEDYDDEDEDFDDEDEGDEDDEDEDEDEDEDDEDDDDEDEDDEK
jgi:translation initiation factor IF-3